MIEQTNKQTNRDYNFIYKDVNHELRPFKIHLSILYLLFTQFVSKFVSFLMVVCLPVFVEPKLARIWRMDAPDSTINFQSLL